MVQQNQEQIILKKMNRLHNRVLIAITGAYKCSSIQKLHRLLEVCKLLDELAVKQSSLRIEKLKRKDYRELMRNEIMKNYNLQYLSIYIHMEKTKLELFCKKCKINF